MALNPARELHAMLSAWQMIGNQRTIRGNRGDNWLNDSIRAVQLLDQVRGLAIDFERTEGRPSPVVAALQPAFEALFNTTSGHHWDSQVSGEFPTISDGDLALLASFADLIDMAMRGIDARGKRLSSQMSATW